MKFGKILLGVVCLNFCWSAFRIIYLCLSLDEENVEDYRVKENLTIGIVGLFFNGMSVLVCFLLGYGVYTADPLDRNGRMYIIPFLIWQPFPIAYEIGLLAYTIKLNIQDVPDDVVLYSIGIIVLSSIYFAVCLKFKYFKSIAKENEAKRKRNFVASQEGYQPQVDKDSSYTSFRDVLPTY